MYSIGTIVNNTPMKTNRNLSNTYYVPDIVNASDMSVNKKDTFPPCALFLMSSLLLITSPNCLSPGYCSTLKLNSSMVSSQMLSLDTEVWLSDLFLHSHD